MLEKRESLRQVFLSYSHKDEEQILKLASRLRAQNIDVWYAPSKIDYVDQIPQEIEDGLRQSQIMVVALSPSSVESFWVRQEWQARLTQMSKDKTRKLIALHLMDCEIPMLLSNFRYVDFRGVDFKDMQLFEDKLGDLVDAINQFLPPPEIKVMGIPVAVIAMTSSEMEELVSGHLIIHNNQREYFHQFIRTLQQRWPQDFISRYDEFREGWHPFLADERTIRQIIDEVMEWVNETQLIHSNIIIRPQYFSDEFLSQDASLRGDTWNYLDRMGCLLVLDGVSVFHPRIQDLFIGSQLGVNDHISLVEISPVNPSIMETNQIIEATMSERLQRVFERYSASLDPQCVFEIGDERTFSRWLYAILPRAVATVQKRQTASPLMRKRLRSAVVLKSSNVFPLIFHEGNAR